MTVRNPLIIEGLQNPAPPISKLAHQRFAFSPRVIPGITMLADFAAVLLSVAVFTFVTKVSFQDFTNFQLLGAGIIVILSPFLMRLAGLCGVDAVMNPLRIWPNVLAVLSVSIFPIATFGFIYGGEEMFSVASLLALGGMAFIVVMSLRCIMRLMLSQLFRMSVIGSNLAVVGTDPHCGRFLRAFRKHEPDLTNLSGVYYDSRPAGSAIAQQMVLGDMDDLIAAIRSNSIDDVVVAARPTAGDRMTKMVDRLLEMPVNVYMTSAESEHTMPTVPRDVYASLPVTKIQQRPLSDWAALLKGIEDRVLGALILVLIGPLLAMIALAIKIDSPGPVFFRQKRLGMNNQEFLIWKFRSMYHEDEDEETVRQATNDDPRVTRIGRLLRKTSLDELPQLFNVLGGSMSLVGPRPHALCHNDEYGRKVENYYARHKVKPGITGWAQVNGLRGETDVDEKMEARVRYDIQYIENWSLGLDFWILFLTIAVVLFQKEAY